MKSDTLHRKVPDQPNDFVVAGVLASLKKPGVPAFFILADLFSSFIVSILFVVVAAIVGWSVASRFQFVPALPAGVLVWAALAVATAFVFAVVIKGMGWTGCFSSFSEDVEAADSRSFDRRFGDSVIAATLSFVCRLLAATTLVSVLISTYLWWRVTQPESLESIVLLAIVSSLGIVGGAGFGLFVGLLGTQIAAVRFVRQLSWSETVREAALHTALNGKLIYRVFVSTLLVIFPALVFLYFTAFVQSLGTIWPEFLLLSELLRSIGNIFFSISIAVAAFYFQAASFWLYAVSVRKTATVPTRTPQPPQTKTVNFDALAPKIRPYIFDTTEILRNGFEESE